jgi:ferritin-like metal-binding protein YciE
MLPQTGDSIMLSQGLKSTESTVAVLAAHMPNRHLHEPFVEELQDIYDAEKQLINAIPKLIHAATSESLKQGLTKHLHETANHVTRLEKVFASVGASVKSKTSAAMKGLIAEGGEAIKQSESKSRDARIIAAAQRIEHYEIATYGTLRSWAEAMQHDDAVALLSDTLDEEKAADENLSDVAMEERNTAVEG